VPVGADGEGGLLIFAIAIFGGVLITAVSEDRAARDNGRPPVLPASSTGFVDYASLDLA